jgi:transcriptional regulator with XRE-family HTH domain
LDNMNAPASPSAVPEWNLADRLRKARISAGLEQADLEEIAGISRKSISNYENGRTVPSKPVLLSWALACGVDLDWLSGSGPTRRGGNGRARERRTAALVPVITAVAGYLSTLTGQL